MPEIYWTQKIFFLKIAFKVFLFLFIYLWIIYWRTEGSFWSWNSSDLQSGGV
jgi:hypothetical protein